ncbi:site-specific integrase [Microtetraspora malaysiensis]|uniref:Site-specific integrase n=1 Tax=Microtetraspora malaysiensis TaxID=161358 RepID=A0ABW6T397_9ACTN
MQAVARNLPDQYAIMVPLGAGCGLRQGEIFGLALDDVDFVQRVIHVRRQVKLLRGRRIFAAPKYDKERAVPLPESVAAELAAYIRRFPPQQVTLPWEKLDGPPTTANLILTHEKAALRRNSLNESVWRPALVAAGVVPKDRPRPQPGRRDQSQREHGMHALRHFYASVLLDAGDSIKAIAEYLGHSDPSFTLRTYTHLMPTSHDRTRKAIDAAFASMAQPVRPVRRVLSVRRNRNGTGDHSRVPHAGRTRSPVTC